MSGRVASPFAGSGNVEVIHQKLVDSRKRRRSKKVSWPTEDKLCQVRLFAAEDAPSFSGAMLQDLLQEKRTGFMHVVAPISADDLPPGFESVPAKRARLADETIAAMVAQTVWRPPDRFSGDPSSLVAVGDLSSEVSLQQQREVRVLEAVYPRSSAIPPSPAEPQEVQAGSDGSELPQTPLIPLEDEDEGDEDDEGAPGFSEECVNQISKNHQAETGKKSISATGEPNIERTTAFFKNADLDVAAAAAAAYAVVKAKETGKFIEPDFLMEILRNPRLLETLATFYPSSKNHSFDLSRNDVAYGRSCEPSLMQSYTGSSTSSSPHVFPERVRLPLPSEGQAVPPSHGQVVAQAWDPARALPQGRNPMTSGPFDQLSGMTGLPGQTKAIYIQGRCYPVRRDAVKEPHPQHPFMGGIHEVQARQHASMCLDEAEWYRSSSFGSRGQLWTTSTQSSLSASAQPFRNMPGAGPKIRKPCLYFNTARGCRNGAKCYYMHDTPENPCFEETKPDIFQLQHARTATLETEYRQ